MNLQNNRAKHRRVLSGGMVLVMGTFFAAGTVGTGIAQQLIKGDFSFLTTLKWGSIIAAIGVGLFFLVREGFLKMEFLEEGERGYRRRWGKIRQYGTAKQRRILYPGRKHFYLKGISDVVVTSVRQRDSRPEKTPIDGSFRGRNVEYLPVIYWQVFDDDECLYKSLTRVHQINRKDEASDALEDYVVGRVLGAISRTLNQFDLDDYGLPVITLDPSQGTVPALLAQEVTDLYDELGVEVVRFELEALTFAPEEKQKEGLLGSTSPQGKRLAGLFSRRL